MIVNDAHISTGVVIALKIDQSAAGVTFLFLPYMFVFTVVTLIIIHLLWLQMLTCGQEYIFSYFLTEFDETVMK